MRSKRIPKPMLLQAKGNQDREEGEEEEVGAREDSTKVAGSDNPTKEDQEESRGEIRGIHPSTEDLQLGESPVWAGDQCILSTTTIWATHPTTTDIWATTSSLQ